MKFPPLRCFEFLSGLEAADVQARTGGVVQMLLRGAVADALAGEFHAEPVGCAGVRDCLCNKACRRRICLIGH